MSPLKLLVSAIALACLLPAAAKANDSKELEALRAEIQQMKQVYELRIQSLESRLKGTENLAGELDKKADKESLQVVAKSSAGNALNPNISLILSGTYADRSQDSNYHITGFQSGGEIGPGNKGFNLGESELGVYANIDTHFYGGLNLALAPDNSVGIEEAFVQTTSLPYGVTLKMGRFFSGIGYLNDQHPHTWDFADNPLVYQAFLGNQFGDDGVQVKWLAPTDLFMEFGVEYGRGRIAGTQGRDKNGGGAGAIFAHIGDDVGVNNNWRAGLSYLALSPQDRQSNDFDVLAAAVVNSFTGNSKMWLADFVWKWAPSGNASNTSLKLQAEYIHRNEKGDLSYDVNNLANNSRYISSQDGFYVQAVYKFLPKWRTGLRYDQLDSGLVDYGLNASNLSNAHYQPQRLSWMVDYNPSDFSRIRLQFSQDKSRQEATDKQVFIQYQMSLGAHGAHKY